MIIVEFVFFLSCIGLFLALAWAHAGSNTKDHHYW
jgi:hypothetical protein